MRVGRSDLAWWLQRYRQLKWTFAKTYAKTAPHHYVVRDKTISTEEMDRLYALVGTFGGPQYYWRHLNLYLVGDEKKWWTAGSSEEHKSLVINMAPADQFFGRQDPTLTTRSGYYSVYDWICLEYDDVVSKAHDQELKAIIALHQPGNDPKTLDIGCGSGRALDLGITTAASYVGVDPSQGLLNALLKKHGLHGYTPRPADLRPARIEDVFEEFVWEEFDLVVSLYGSPSYVDPGMVEFLPALSKGITVLMTYKPGYLPYWHREYAEIGGKADLDRTDRNAEAVAKMARQMGGERYELGNFDVTVIP